MTETTPTPTPAGPVELRLMDREDYRHGETPFVELVLGVPGHADAVAYTDSTGETFLTRELRVVMRPEAITLYGLFRTDAERCEEIMLEQWEDAITLGEAFATCEYLRDLQGTDLTVPADLAGLRAPAL